jgi:hypothetical protein
MRCRSTFSNEASASTYTQSKHVKGRVTTMAVWRTDHKQTVQDQLHQGSSIGFEVVQTIFKNLCFKHVINMCCEQLNQSTHLQLILWGVVRHVSMGR